MGRSRPGSVSPSNIAAIYGIEEAEGTRALVLELVDGPTLADRIAKGPIPLDTSSTKMSGEICAATGHSSSARGR